MGGLLRSGPGAPGLQAREDGQGGLVVGTQDQSLSLQALGALDFVRGRADALLQHCKERAVLHPSQIAVGSAQPDRLPGRAAHGLGLIRG